MNQSLEFHDSDLAALELDGDTAVLSLRPAYIHRSDGQPGTDSGSGWLQEAVITISNATVVSSPHNLPVTISDGTLRIGKQLFENLIPVPASFDSNIELQLVLTNAQLVHLQGQHIEITLIGEPVYLEETPFASPPGA